MLCGSFITYSHGKMLFTGLTDLTEQLSQEVKHLRFLRKDQASSTKHQHHTSQKPSAPSCSPQSLSLTLTPRHSTQFPSPTPAPAPQTTDYMHEPQDEPMVEASANDEIDENDVVSTYLIIYLHIINTSLFLSIIKYQPEIYNRAFIWTTRFTQK